MSTRTEWLERIRSSLIRRAVDRRSDHPRLEIPGSGEADPLSIVCFAVRHADRGYLHRNPVVALPNDLFGIQSRGGCSCARPCGHRLPGEVDPGRTPSASTGVDGGATDRDIGPAPGG